MAQGPKHVTVKALCRYIKRRMSVQLPLEEIKYIILSIVRSGVEAKCDVEFRHSTRNAKENKDDKKRFIK